MGPYPAEEQWAGGGSWDEAFASDDHAAPAGERAHAPRRRRRTSGIPRSRKLVTDEEAAQSQFTTVMVRNLPNDYDREALEALFEAVGLKGRYDFCYLPVDFRRQCGLGYAFVNFLSYEDAMCARQRLEDFSDWEIAGSQKVCKVCWAEPEFQGWQSNIDRYRNSPVMHEMVDQRYQPAVYRDGEKVSFPASTKRLRKPRPKRQPDIWAAGAGEAEGSPPA